MRSFAAWICPLGCLLVVVSTCTGGESATPKDARTSSGGGIAVYWNSDLRPLVANEGSRSFMATVLGLSTVELLERTADGRYVAVAMPAPPPRIVGETQTVCQPRTPIAVVPVDLDGDGHLDAVVEDACGAYVIFGVQSGAPRTADRNSTFLGTNDSYPFVEVATMDDHSTTVIARGLQIYTEFSAFDSGAFSWVDWGGPKLPRQTWTPELTRAFLPLIGTARKVEWLVQGGRQLFLVAHHFSSDTEDSSIPAWTWQTFKQQTPVLPYLVPFEVYDHLVALQLPGCPLIALGIGLFSPNPNPSPRKIQLLQFPEDLTAVHILAEADRVF